VVTIAEGAAKLQGRIVAAEGQTVSRSVRVYLVPAERDAAENVLRFYEARPNSDRSFTVDNLAPGNYWIFARPAEENEFGIAKAIRQDAAFRAKVLREAEALKKDVAFKPCEQVADYDLPYTAPTNP
jgi:hypothetical protein